jgi:hypothetical protein
MVRRICGSDALETRASRTSCASVLRTPVSVFSQIGVTAEITTMS